MKRIILFVGIIGALFLFGCGSPESTEQVVEKEALEEEIQATENTEEAIKQETQSIADEVEIARKKIEKAVGEFKEQTLEPPKEAKE